MYGWWVQVFRNNCEVRGKRERLADLLSVASRNIGGSYNREDRKGEVKGEGLV